MKRLVFVSFLVFAVLLGFYLSRERLSFLGDHGPGKIFSQESLVETSTKGVIKSFGTFAAAESGTHFLEQENGETLLLIGLGTDLDQYVGKKVEVRGYMGSTPSGKELLQVLSVDRAEDENKNGPSEEKIFSSEDTSWLAFSNEKFGVSFQRRNHWNMSTDDEKIQFTLPPLPPPPCSVDPCVVPKEDFITMKPLKNEKRSSLSFFLANKEIQPASSKIGVDSLNALSYYYDHGLVEIYVARDQYVYLLSYLPSEKRSGDSHKNDFFQLVSTFRFVPFGS